MTMTNETGLRNGVDTTTLFATLDAVKEAPEAAKSQFRASNQWLSGTHSRGTMHGYFGVGEEREPREPAVRIAHDAFERACAVERKSGLRCDRNGARGNTHSEIASDVSYCH